MVENIQPASPNLEEPAHCGAKEIPRTNGVVDFERLYRMHVRRVYRLCWHMVWDKADAEDLTQEVFVQVLRKINTFRGEAAFTTWLHRLAVNVVLMRMRRKSRIEPSLGEGTESGGRPDAARKEMFGPDSALTGTLDRLDLEQALAQLPAGYRMIFVLHDVEGYGHGEIAQILGVRAGTSKSQLHKARLRLRDMLCKPGNQDPHSEIGSISQAVRPRMRVRRRKDTKDRSFVLTPEGVFHRASNPVGPLELHPGMLGEPINPTNERFELMEAAYAKTQCA